MKGFLSLCLILILIVMTGTVLAETAYTFGDIITFGKYEQDNDLTNGAEPIEWIVLDKKTDGSYVLLSQYALDCRPYNTDYADVTWETCTLRKWLNEDFYDAAFNEDEKACILTTNVENEDNPYYGIPGGNATQDKVYLLSLNEVTDRFTDSEKYEAFTDNNARICAQTKYAKAQAGQNKGCNVDDVVVCWWWLRSPGYLSQDAAYVDTVGSVGYLGNSIRSKAGSVRPVIVILP